MNNKDYSKYIESYKGDKQKLVCLIDKIRLAKKTYGDVFTDFLTPDEQAVLESIARAEDVYVSFFGGKGDFERAVGVISKYEFHGEFPVDVLEVNGNFKFQKLTHRDYLGALLSLGIKREKIGDINVYEDGAEIWIYKDISDYVCLSLTKIKNTGVKVERISYENAKEKIQEFKQYNVNVASLRLDAVLSSALNLSRNEASKLIKSGDVKVNYVVVEEASKKVSEGDLISARGHGRYKVDSILGTTRKDRIVLSIKKYV
jgi:RNA-binding protein YlmH